MGGLLFGYEIGVIGQVLAMESFTTYFDFYQNANSDSYNSLITGLFLTGCVFGAAACMFVVDNLGRKYSIVIGGILFAIGGTLQAAAVSLPMLLIGRLFSGLAIGTLSMVVPVYLAETAETKIRGTVTTVYQLM